MENLSDIQWCALDLLMRAKQKGASRINRHELLYSSPVPDGVKIKLVWALLTMPHQLVKIHGEHDFEITTKGEQLFNMMFNKPTKAADVIIALPDRSSEVVQ